MSSVRRSIGLSGDTAARSESEVGGERTGVDDCDDSPVGNGIGRGGGGGEKEDVATRAAAGRLSMDEFGILGDAAGEEE